LDLLAAVLLVLFAVLSFLCGYSAGTANKKYHGASQFLDGFRMGRNWNWSKSSPGETQVPEAFLKAIKGE